MAYRKKPGKNTSHISLSDPRHLMRHLKAQGGMSEEQIAKAEGVSVVTVHNSIYQVDQFQKRNSTGEMQLAIRDFVMSTMPQAKETLIGLLQATEMVEVIDPKTGMKKVVQVEDKTTRLEATRIHRQLIADQMPKVPLIEQTITQTNQTANISGAETMEERLRRLRQKAQEHNQLPPEVAGVPKFLDEGKSVDEVEDADEGEYEESED